MGDSEHFVQFYESDEFMVHAVSGFIGSALARGDAGIVVVTPAHRTAIEHALTELGLDVFALAESGRYVAWDAAETLERFMVGGMPDGPRFQEVAGAALSRFEESGVRLRAFGEMVALLVDSGNRAAAIRLEELWNGLAETRRFALFCAYPVRADLDGAALGAVCRQHSGVIPGEGYSALDSSGDRMRAIVQLQQRVRQLEEELAKRNEVETAFLRRLRTAKV